MKETTSWRRSPLPKNWQRLRSIVIRRAGGKCEGIRHGGKSCPFPGTEVDHIRGHDNHSLDNLQLLCRTCHGRKTQREAMEAYQDKIGLALKKHPLAP